MQTLPKKTIQYSAMLGQKPVLQTTPRHDGSFHVELVNGKYHYVRTERGAENERRISENEDELLFWLFSKRIELMGTIKPEWAERTRQDLQEILAEHPYSD